MINWSILRRNRAQLNGKDLTEYIKLNNLILALFIIYRMNKAMYIKDNFTDKT